MGNSTSSCQQVDIYSPPTSGQWVLLAFELLFALISPFLVKLIFMYIDFAADKLQQSFQNNFIENEKKVSINDRRSASAFSSNNSRVESSSNSLRTFILPLRSYFSKPLTILVMGAFLYGASNFATYPPQICYLQIFLSSIFLAVILSAAVYFGAMLLDYIVFVASIIFQKKDFAKADNANEYYSNRSIPELNALIEIFLYAKNIFIIAMIIIITETVLSQLLEKQFTLTWGANVISVSLILSITVYLREIISGLTLLVDRPFSVGSIITVNEVSGKVVYMGLRSVVLQQSDGYHVRVSANIISQDPVTIYSLNNSRLAHFEIKLIENSMHGEDHLRKILSHVEKRIIFYKNELLHSNEKNGEKRDVDNQKDLLKEARPVNQLDVNDKQASKYYSNSGYTDKSARKGKLARSTGLEYGNEFLIGLKFKGEFYVSSNTCLDSRYCYKSSAIETLTLVVRFYIPFKSFKNFILKKSEIMMQIVEYLEKEKLINPKI